MIRRTLATTLWCAGLFAVICHYYPVFKLREILVQGNSAVPADSLARLLGAAPGDNLMQLDLNSWVERAARMPAIARAHAHASLYGQATLTVEEVRPDFLIDTQPVSGMTDNGVILPLDRHPPAGTLPLVTGIGGVPGYYRVSFDEKLRTARRFYERWNTLCGEYNDRLSEIHVTDDLEVGVYLWPERRYVMIGRGDWDLRLGDLWRIMKRLPPGEYPLDVRFAGQVLEKS